MKSIIILLVTVFLFSIEGYSQTDYYYYYKNEKRHFQVNTNKAYLQLSNKMEIDQLAQILGDKVSILDLGVDKTPITYRLNKNDKSSSLPTPNYWATIQFNEHLSKNQYFDKLKKIREKTEVRIIMPYLLNFRGNEVGISQYLYLKLKSNQNIDVLEQICQEHHLEIVGQYPYRQWYIVGCTPNTQFNTIEIAALLHEQNIFKVVEPDLMTTESSHCVDDPNQWGVDAVGQTITNTVVINSEGDEVTVTVNPTTDINACDAWTVTTGNPNLIVAVFDDGIHLHNDLNFLSVTQSYDAYTDESPADVYGTHGTSCAGIIGGIHNGTGISGIAPNCNLMSISDDFSFRKVTPASRANRSRGFDFAREQGVSVINCSWGAGDDPIQILDEAITEALDNGRNGLGMVVVFSSGNNYEEGEPNAVRYPASSNNDIITVGAMSPCEERKEFSISCDQEPWESEFGPELDIVAPGPFTPSTIDNNGFTSTFSGTSAAAPHVSGVAALILSINPCLTNREVSDIIEHTAQKVGSYSYGNTTGRPNGTWHEEVGYGLVDAFQSLLHTNTLFLQNQIDVGTEGHENIGSIRTGSNVDVLNPINADYVVDAGADVTLKATEEIKLEVGTKIKAGSNFHAYIDSYNGNCNDWLLTRTAPVDDPTIDDNVVVMDKSNNIDENIEQQVEVNIYPNPFENNFNLGINLTQSDDYSLNVFNATGQLIYNENGQLDIGKHLLNIPINQGNGLCIVRLQIGDKIITKKLMKYE